MNNFYKILDQLREFLLLSDFTNTVTFGEISDVDLDKLTNFPLVHLVIREAVIDENTIEFVLDVIAADIVDVSKELPEDKFLGNNNLQDILNTQLKVITDATNFFRRNDYYSSGITITDTVRATPFLERFNNQLAGWEASISLKTSMQDKC
jgi:hypothetical protein